MSGAPPRRSSATSLKAAADAALATDGAPPGAAELASAAAAGAGGGSAGGSRPPVGPPHVTALAERLAALDTELAALRKSIADRDFGREMERIAAVETALAAQVEERKKRHAAADAARLEQQAARQADSVKKFEAVEQRLIAALKPMAAQAAIDAEGSLLAQTQKALLQAAATMTELMSAHDARAREFAALSVVVKGQAETLSSAMATALKAEAAVDVLVKQSEGAVAEAPVSGGVKARIEAIELALKENKADAAKRLEELEARLAADAATKAKADAEASVSMQRGWASQLASAKAETKGVSTAIEEVQTSLMLQGIGLGDGAESPALDFSKNAAAYFDSDEGDGRVAALIAYGGRASEAVVAIARDVAGSRVGAAASMAGARTSLVSRGGDAPASDADLLLAMLGTGEEVVYTQVTPRGDPGAAEVRRLSFFNMTGIIFPAVREPESAGGGLALRIAPAPSSFTSAVDRATYTYGIPREAQPGLASLAPEDILKFLNSVSAWADSRSKKGIPPELSSAVHHTALLLLRERRNSHDMAERMARGVYDSPESAAHPVTDAAMILQLCIDTLSATGQGMSDILSKVKEIVWEVAEKRTKSSTLSSIATWLLTQIEQPFHGVRESTISVRNCERTLICMVVGKLPVVMRERVMTKIGYSHSDVAQIVRQEVPTGLTYTALKRAILEGASETWDFLASGGDGGASSASQTYRIFQHGGGGAPAAAARTEAAVAATAPAAAAVAPADTRSRRAAAGRMQSAGGCLCR